MFPSRILRINFGIKREEMRAKDLYYFVLVISITETKIESAILLQDSVLS